MNRNCQSSHSQQWQLKYFLEVNLILIKANQRSQVFLAWKVDKSFGFKDSGQLIKINKAQAFKPS